ncbi:MAG: N-acetylmuramoyl-L-alanine amidase [Thermoleophilia bacterium]|jgi:N-acetylmuramoyl-L-alanine amidase
MFIVLIMDDLSTNNPDNRTRRRKLQLARRRRQRLVFLGAVVVLLLVLVAVVVSRALSSEQLKSSSGMSEPLDAQASTVLGPPPVEASRPVEGPATNARTASVAAPAAAGSSLAGKVIVIDPGHAANTDMGMEPAGPGSSIEKVKDPGGTSGVATGVREPVVTLAISLDLKTILEAKGARVVMTRESDVFNGGNRERAQIANQAGGQLFIRIHCDGSTDNSTSGASTLHPALIPGWTDDIYSPSYKAATAVQSALVTDLGIPDHGTVERSDMTGFNWADVPAILPEVGFMSNPGEDVRLNSADYQLKVAQALARGIEVYFAAAS